MTYFAKVNNRIVEQVIVAEQAFADSQEGTWIQTYKTGSNRKNYAGVGFTYDSTRDAFIAPQPFPSWILDEVTCKWNAPANLPEDAQDKHYVWNEETTNWKLVYDTITQMEVI